MGNTAFLAPLAAAPDKACPPVTRYFAKWNPHLCVIRAWWHATTPPSPTMLRRPGRRYKLTRPTSDQLGFPASRSTSCTPVRQMSPARVSTKSPGCANWASWTPEPLFAEHIPPPGLWPARSHRRSARTDTWDDFLTRRINVGYQQTVRFPQGGGNTLPGVLCG